MPITLTTPFTLQNGTRLVFGRFEFDDETQTLTVPVELRSPQASNMLIARAMLYVRNGECSLLSRQLSPVAGLNVDDPTRYFIQTTHTVAAGYTDARAIERAANNNPGARRTALEAHFLAAGHVDASLTGS